MNSVPKFVPGASMDCARKRAHTEKAVNGSERVKRPDEVTITVRPFKYYFKTKFLILISLNKQSDPKLTRIISRRFSARSVCNKT